MFWRPKVLLLYSLLPTAYNAIMLLSISCNSMRPVLLKSGLYTNRTRSLITGLHRLVPSHGYRNFKKHAGLSRAQNTLLDRVLSNPSAQKRSSSILTRRENIYTLPNALTLSRILACPFLGWFIVSDNFAVATGILVYAGVSDWVIDSNSMSGSPQADVLS